MKSGVGSRESEGKTFGKILVPSVRARCLFCSRPTPDSRLPTPSALHAAPLSLCLSVLLALASLAPAAEPLTPVAPRPAAARVDSLKSPPPLTGLDSLRALAARADTAGSKTRADTARVVEHHFNHRQQIITGSVVMACLAGVMVFMNNYNPRPVSQF